MEFCSRGSICINNFLPSCKYLRDLVWLFEYGEIEDICSCSACNKFVWDLQPEIQSLRRAWSHCDCTVRAPTSTGDIGAQEGCSSAEDT
ncbi:hypothetical protein GDO81_017313 [Engystomops pustulosus]|uniref:Uncharacterized protein n=1 Tax=Engystomops pustulosus TaxID=76066 RepID=A0AAV7AKX2_ENGPU|nr:hypothetical protein GDO81_017313 [Engystomops pustulosus]